MEFRRLRRLCIKALLNGATKTVGTGVHWDLSRGCSSPKYVAHGARPDAKGRERTIRVAPGKPIPLNLTIEVPCGKCIKCRMRSRRSWAARAIAEARVNILDGSRIWMATLTCSPDYLYRSRCGATERVKRRIGLDFDAIGPERQFRELDREIYRDISKFLKRLRAGQDELGPAQFRYLCVTEAHVSGAPHYHMLIHEADVDKPILKDALKTAEWNGGFSHYKLVEKENVRAVTYACKYLMKSGGRIRASKNYGKTLERPNVIRTCNVDRTSEASP